MSIIKNIRLRGLKDILNPKKWKIFARYLKMKALKEEYQELNIRAYQEQIVLRMKHPECQRCIKEGECFHCGCKSPELFFDKDNYCSGGAWDAMMNPDQWEEFKRLVKMPDVSEDDINYLLKHGTIKLD